MRAQLATAVMVGLLCLPGLSSAEGGRFKGMVQTIQKPFQKVAAKVQAFRQNWKEQRIVSKNVRALRKASPELNDAYKTARKASHQSNRGLLLNGSALTLVGVNFGVRAAAHYGAGDPVFGTVFAAGSAASLGLGGAGLKHYFRQGKLAGQQAVMDKLLTSDGLRQQLGSKLDPTTIKVVRGRIAQDQAANQSEINDLQQKLAQRQQKNAVSTKLVNTLDSLLPK